MVGGDGIIPRHQDDYRQAGAISVAIGDDRQENVTSGGTPPASGASQGPSGERPTEPDMPGAPTQLPELAEALREKEQFRKLAQRVQADFINYRNRTQEEVDDARRGAVRRFATRVLEVMDLFDAALTQKASAGVEANWVNGVIAIQRSLAASLASEGIERMKVAAGDAFDPRRHEALLSTPTVEYEAGAVVHELRSGYVKGNEVIRPAQVSVAVAPPGDEDGPQSAST
ncbi:MAG: nucleotide exchange factor GrpE [Dehalococcoidia bacterium]|nr:nucleotide exchange factor GrpE [Dehalococcoidia bacterium]